MLRLIYPTKRPISEAEVISWAHDLRMDEALKKFPLNTPQAELDAAMKAVPRPTLDEAIFELQDSGAATFARGTK